MAFDRLHEIAKRWAEVGGAQWRSVRSAGGTEPWAFSVTGKGGRPVCMCESQAVANAVAESPEDVRWLLEELQRVTRELEELKAEAAGTKVIGKSRDGEITLATFKLQEPKDE